MSDSSNPNDGAASTAAETQSVTQTSAPAQRQPRSREGGQQVRSREPQGSQVNGLAWVIVGIAITLLVLWLIDKFGPGTTQVVPPTPVAVVTPPPAPAPGVVTPPPAPVAPLDPTAALALMGAPGSGFVPGTPTGRGPQVFSLQETNLPGIGRCYMVNVAERRGISAPPGTAIPAPEYQMANPPQGLRWVATDKPDPKKPGAVYYVLAP